MRRSAGESKVYSFPGLISTVSKIQTLYETFMNGYRLARHLPFLGKRHGSAYRWVTYDEIHQMSLRLGAFLLDHQAAYFPSEPLTGWNVGIYLINCPEWVIIEKACNAFSLVSVALYDTLGHESIGHVVNDSELSIIFCTRGTLDNILGLEHAPSVRAVVCLSLLETDPNADEIYRLANEKMIKLFSWDQVLNANPPADPIPPSPDTVATICYTSGTTSLPKGAILTHRNMVSVLGHIGHIGLVFSNEDIHISYLPLAHCFERLMHTVLTSMGGRIGFYGGNIQNLADDIKVLGPTVMAGVPRLFNKIMDRIAAKTTGASGIRGYLFRKAYEVKVKQLREGGAVQHYFLDKLFFGRIASAFGGRIRLIITASAPIGPEVIEFLRVVFSSQVLEGYGMTETAATGALVLPGDYSVGNVGYPMYGCEIKVIDVREMEYLSTDKPNPRGEICIRGLCVFQGYRNRPKETMEVLDKEGWYHTGDIGSIDAQGHISLINRKNQVFKLSQGEYIAPEKLESVYSRCEEVLQIFVHGNPMKHYLVAIVVPDQTVVKEPSKNQILDVLSRQARANKLQGFEHVKNVYIETEPFSVENGLLTPTMKLRRGNLIKQYSAELEKLYQEGIYIFPPNSADC